MARDGIDRLALALSADGMSRRRALRLLVGGTVASTIPWAFPRRALAANCAEYCASGGGCTGAESACCCVQRTENTIQVGGCYDPSTHYCKDTGSGVIPACKEELVCGSGCCKPGQRCVDGRCQDGGCGEGKTACGDTCCDASEKCCAGICCPGDHGCCKDNCCAPGKKCCTDHCCDKNQACCGDKCCPPGQKCGAKIGRGDVQCCPPKRIFRQGGRSVCCPPGTVAGDSGCCPTGDPNCCGDLPPLGRKKVCVNGKSHTI